MTIDLESFERLATSRRSSLLVDRERPVPDELVERLCRLVFAAPNHKRTGPWRVAVFTGDGRRQLGEALGEDLLAAKPDVPDVKVDKTRSKYGRAPAVVAIGCRPDNDPIRHREDEAAVAAGIENLLLGASAAGLAALWSSPPVLAAAQTCAVAGFDDGTELLGLVYLGWPSTAPPDTMRAEPVIVWVR